MPTRSLPIVAFGALVAAAAGQYFIRQDPHSAIATGAFLVAALAAAVSLRRGCDEVDRIEPTAGQGAAAGLALSFLGAALLVGGVTLLFYNWSPNFYFGWGSVILGTALLSAGLRIYEGPAPRTWRWSDTVALASIVAIGAALRFHNYSDWPGAFTTHAIEEQQTGLGGFRVLVRGQRPWEFWLDYQMTALALWFDPNPTFNTIRVPHTIVSALTPIPVYFLLRQLVRTPAARFATLLYAASSWNLLYSRCAHNIFTTNFLVVAILALLVHWGRTRRLVVLPWIGLLAGYTLYSYAGYRGTPVFVLVFLAGCIVADLWRWRRAVLAERGGAQRRVIRDIGATLIVGAVIVGVAAPIGTALGPAGRAYYFEAASRATANREYYTDDTRKFVEQRAERIRQSAAIFMHLGDGSPTFNSWGKPMLDPATAVLFVVGLFIACLRPLRRYNAFLVFVFMTLMLVGTVFVQNLDIRRLQGITVLIAAFCAVSFDSLWGLTRGRWRQGLLVLAAAVGVSVTWSAYDLYFRQMAGDAGIRMAFRDQYTTLIHWGYSQPRKHPILLQSLVHRFFDSSYHYRYNYSWLIDAHLEGTDLGDATELLEPRMLTMHKTRTVVIQEPFERHAVAKLLTAAYPVTQCTEFAEADSARTALTVCETPEQLAAPRVRATLAARYFFGGELDRAPFMKRREPFLGFGTYPRACYTPRPGQFCHGVWDGSVTVPATGEYRIVLTATGRTTATATVDGTPIPPDGLQLGPGTHAVHVEATLPRDWEAGVRLSWRHDGVEEVIPFYEPSV